MVVGITFNVPQAIGPVRLDKIITRICVLKIYFDLNKDKYWLENVDSCIKDGVKTTDSPKILTVYHSCSNRVTESSIL